MRCSDVFGAGVGVGRVVRVRDWEWASGCWIANMVLGTVILIVVVAILFWCGVTGFWMRNLG